MSKNATLSQLTWTVALAVRPVQLLAKRKMM